MFTSTRFGKLGTLARLCCAAFAALGAASASLAQTGACCASTTCTATTAGCTGTAIFIPNGACTPNSCAGACCSGTGTCSITAQSGCSGANTYLGLGTVCSPATICNGFLGACCSNIGVCAANVTPANCTGTNLFQGFGSSCSPQPCSASVGACCAENGSCTLTAATACALPATFIANGTACGSGTCTFPTGACCAADGTCAIKNASGTGAGSCGGTVGDSYQGDGTACPGPCPALTGACCATTGACSIKTIAGCAATTNQTFNGVGTACVANSCPVGACCPSTGACTSVIASGCTGTSVYQGNNSSCSPDPCPALRGACCPNGTAACSVTLPSGCTAALFGVFSGVGATCSPDPCAAQRGACCSSTAVCTSTTFLGCNGVYQGVGTACNNSPCATFEGACCNAVGGCIVTIATGCTGTNSFRGASTVCFPTGPCGVLQGVCCSSIGACTVTILSGCTVPNTFTSTGTTCSNSPCSGLLGACCSNLGGCSSTVASGCTGTSFFSGVGSSCTPNTCTPTSGACCDAGMGTCTQTPASGCAGANVFWGAGISCNPGNPCAQPAGACCIGTFCTADTQAADCISVGGSFFFGQACSASGPCVRPLVDISQIFPSGGENGSPFTYDYVELFNRGTSDVNLANWSIQFGAQSTQTFPQRATIGGTIQAGHYFLVQLASANTSVGADLPVAPDWVSTSNTNLDVTGGRLALVSNSNALPAGCPVPLPVNIVDYVGYGPPSGTGSPTCAEGGSPTGSRGGNIYAFYRRANGCQDTDNNGADFTQPLTPNPRNSSFSYICGSSNVGACCDGESCSTSTQAACPGGGANYYGDGTTCTNNPCLIAKGSCCNGTSCTFVVSGDCPTASIYTFGRACSPDPCSGACCNGTTCTFTSATACVSPAYFITGTPCSPGICPGPTVVQSGDIVYGASVPQNQDAIQQIRGAGVANPTRVGTWARYFNLQIVRLDSRNGVLHNAAGNLLAMDFGTLAAGGAIYDLPTTTGDATAGSTLFAFTDAAAPFGLTRSRLGGLSVSPNNDRIACIGYDFAKLYVLSYNPGATPGTGAGATIDGGTSTDNNTFVFGFNITQGTAWLDNDHVLMWVLSDQASILKVYSVPVSGSGANISLGTPVEMLAVQDNKPNSSRFTSIAYNPQLIPGYIFLGSSAFQSVSLNSAYVVDITQPTWHVVKTIDLSVSLQTERELAIGPDRNLYLGEFAGAGQQATDPLIDKITLDANGDGVVTAAEIAALTDNCSVDFYLKGQANTSSFNALDIAVQLGACCAGTTCTIQPPNFCTGTNGVYQGNDTACIPTNPCLAPTGVCCRGSTCTTTITSEAACASSLVAGQKAGATFAASSNCNSAGNTTSPCCYANYNKINGISVQDIFDFLSDWFAGSPYANTGGTGAAGPLSVQNIFNFLSDWFAGGC